MGRTLRLSEGRFGRLVLAELAIGDCVEAKDEPVIVLQSRYDAVFFLNPGEAHASAGPTRVLALHAAREWLQSSFPAVFEPRDGRPFTQASGKITPRIRQLADALDVEVVNDRFLSPERLEFMLQELLLSIFEAYFARRRTSSRLWRGSRFEDLRIRRAIALLRERRNKELSMNEVASEVGLSRSRFYDLFHLCTGFSPRTYLDMLCVETAISRLSSGRGKIAEVAAELGFSAQSNFTRFFLNQVGVPPSEYRRATSTPPEEPARNADPSAPR
ncbi:MAG: helix-turn-helix domain-containing protein [Burkholderiales bacterium]